MLIKIFILPIRFYRYFISPLFPPSCRFEPTCSAYAIEVIQGTEGIGFITFSSADVVRHPLVKKIIDAYKIFEEKLGK